MSDVTKYGTATDSALAGDDWDREATAAGALESITTTISNTGPVENQYLVVSNAELGGIPPTTGTFTFVAEITSSDADFDLRVRVQRYNNLDNVQASSAFTAVQTLSADGEFTFTMASVDLGTWFSNDYLAVHLECDGTGAHGNASVIFEMDVAANNRTRITYPVADVGSDPPPRSRRDLYMQLYDL